MATVACSRIGNPCEAVAHLVVQERQIIAFINTLLDLITQEACEGRVHGDRRGDQASRGLPQRRLWAGLFRE